MLTENSKKQNVVKVAANNTKNRLHVMIDDTVKSR